MASARAIVATLGELPVAERPGVFVCASAVGYYGDRGDERLDEASRPGEGFLAALCIDWEDAAGAARAHGVRVVQLRIGVVLAPNGGALSLGCSSNHDGLALRGRITTTSIRSACGGAARTALGTPPGPAATMDTGISKIE